MRRLLVLLFSSVLLGGIASARSSVGDWQSVQDIPAGWQITVVTEFTFPCIFAQASDQELICTLLQRPGTTAEGHEIHVRRDRIQEVRVERRDGANMLAGAGGGGALGAVLGAVHVAGARGALLRIFSGLVARPWEPAPVKACISFMAGLSTVGPRPART